MMDMFDTSKPIYRQIADQFYWRIIRGELQPGDKLPSVRECAVEFKVNPNTVARTYNEMEREDVVETKRGQGTFVTTDEEVLFALKENMKKVHIEQFVHEMEEMGYTKEEMISSLKEFLDGRDSDD